MAETLNPIVVIPSRLASTRLPEKPLALIGNDPMIVHVWRCAAEANVGPVIVACGDPEIKDAVEAAGGEAVMTAPDLPSGSDRVFAAVEAYDPKAAHNVVINLQGDLPILDPAAVQSVLAPMADDDVDISTLVSEIHDPDEITNSNVVKAACGFPPTGRIARALYFSRNPVPHGDGPLYHHIGIYGFRRTALKRFVGLPQTVLEQRERLEQLRAMEAGMRVDAALVDTIPLGVDTPEDLEKVRALYAQKQGKAD